MKIVEKSTEKTAKHEENVVELLQSTLNVNVTETLDVNVTNRSLWIKNLNGY